MNNKPINMNDAPEVRLESNPVEVPLKELGAFMEGARQQIKERETDMSNILRPHPLDAKLVETYAQIEGPIPIPEEQQKKQFQDICDEDQVLNDEVLDLLNEFHDLIGPFLKKVCDKFGTYQISGILVDEIFTMCSQLRIERRCGEQSQEEIADSTTSKPQLTITDNIFMTCPYCDHYGVFSVSKNSPDMYTCPNCMTDCRPQNVIR